jgi:hypothetical protein
MRRAYTLIYNSTLGTFEEVKKWATDSKQVVTWRYELPNCFWLISENSAVEIHEDIERQFGTRGRYIVTEVTDNRQGRLTTEGWYLLRNKVHKPGPKA